MSYIPRIPDPASHYSYTWATALTQELSKFVAGLRGDFPVNGKLQTASGRCKSVSLVVEAAHTVETQKEIIDVNFPGAVAITLPDDVPAGTIWVIQDSSGAASSNTITITPTAGNINGAGSVTITTDYGSLEIYYNGTQFIAG